MTTSDAEQGAGSRAAQRLDIDVRFLLANERTLLAWLRTGLTLQAAGVALTHLSRGDRTAAVVGVALLALGTVGVVVGYLRYRAADRAIRTGALPSPGHGASLVTAGVVAVAVVLLAVYAAQLA